MAVRLLILQTTIIIDFGFNNQILKLLNQTYPWNYLSEHYCCNQIKNKYILYGYLQISALKISEDKVIHLNRKVNVLILFIYMGLRIFNFNLCLVTYIHLLTSIIHQYHPDQQKSSFLPSNNCEFYIMPDWFFH